MKTAAKLLLLGSTSAVPTDPDAAAWANAVVANGGTVSAARLAIVSAFIGALKSAGIWDKRVDYAALAAENQAQALTSLKLLKFMTPANSPTFATTGVTFDGTSNYIGWGLIPSADGGGIISATDIALCTYETTALSSSGYALGAATGGNNLIEARARVGGARLATPALVWTAADNRGWFVAQQRPGATYQVWIDGAAQSVTPPAAGSGSLPAVSVWLGAVNSNGTLVSPRACSLALAAIGASLSDAQAAAETQIVNDYVTAIGAHYS